MGVGNFSSTRIFPTKNIFPCGSLLNNNFYLLVYETLFCLTLSIRLPTLKSRKWQKWERNGTW